MKSGWTLVSRLTNVQPAGLIHFGGGTPLGSRLSSGVASQNAVCHVVLAVSVNPPLKIVSFAQNARRVHINIEDESFDPRASSFLGEWTWRISPDGLP